ncbi:uncharacterized protein C3orf84 [Patella vulgata]|uniref:uncharacterized protein C3orf84 n=1 Tax=Patella vulgata TaxID=6465 RepID=UPI0024A885B4|nr:uncharacterized protein C3orf84 [Patella vulgata]XP_055958095.1 uncharacterized protein C3orf84 [Patella vulgata]
MPSHIVGSWFPTGFHGHFRNKTRNDFVCEYRILAKPQPPEKFLRRSVQPGSKNVFSHHDNRHSFLNDAMIFEQGLGRKRIQNSTYDFKPNFITWMPEKEYVERMRPLLSTYHIDYKREQIRPSTQLLVERPKTSFDCTPTTTYRYSHCSASPNQNMINAMNNEALKITKQHQIQRAKSAKARVRESVASCLSWYNPPHPPTSPKVGVQIDCLSPEKIDQNPTLEQPVENCTASTNVAVCNNDDNGE